MAYNPNKAADVAALKTELTTDPLAHGYDLAKPKAAANILNDRGGNLTVDPSVQRQFTEIRLEELWADGVIDQTEYDHVDTTSLIKAKLAGLMAQDNTRFMTEETRLFFRNSFPGNQNSATFGTNITGLRTITGSRGESLFGYGTVISRADVAKARDS